MQLLLFHIFSTLAPKHLKKLVCCQALASIVMYYKMFARYVDIGEAEQRLSSEEVTGTTLQVVKLGKRFKPKKWLCHSDAT